MVMQHSNPNLTSKKRTRPSSFTTGIFTRYKSQSYLHCNRSGATRFDSSSSQKMNLNPVSKRPRNTSDHDLSPTFIRDLRTRRVFSPGSSIKNEREKDEFGDDVNGEGKKGDLNVNAENVGFENCLKEEDECLQSTPPDIEMFGCEMPSKLDHNVNNSVGDNNRNGNKFILRACCRSRERIFKAPGSLSYRRLLPFLDDMAKETTHVETKINMEDQKLPPIEAVAKNQIVISPHLSLKPGSEVKQRIEVQECVRDDDFQSTSHGCPPQRENLMSDSSTNSMPMCNETEKINVEPSCGDELRSDAVQMMSVKSVKDLWNRSEEACKNNNDEARPVGCQQPDKRFETADPCISLSDTVEARDDNVFGGSQGESANSNEEHIQLVQTVINKNTNASAEDAIESSIKLPQNPADRTILSNNAGEHVKLAPTNLRSKLVSSPCAKLKRFKTPSSFSYKRMLPFLMEITKDGSGDIVNSHSRDRGEVNQLLTSSSEIDGIPSGKQNTNSHEMQVFTDKATSVASDSNSLNQISAKQVNSNYVSFSSHELESPTKEAGVEKDKERLSSVVSGGYSPSIEHPQCAKALEVSDISRNSSLHGTQPSRIAKCSRKSILKRNPRGCRGLCNCLDCASFRLHAERAFEFSEYQMQDAEEIALNLVWELSQLRTILEKTSSSDANSGVICSNQVKEACKKASEAEELAKGRLSEMISDLNVHCRIPCSQPPRVTFAIDERLVSEALQTKTEEKPIN